LPFVSPLVDETLIEYLPDRVLVTLIVVPVFFDVAVA
jgi:hypothetical protein